MSAPVIVVLFGLSCAEPCAVRSIDLERVEADVVHLLAKRGFGVRPPPEGARRPTGATASVDNVDESAAVSADRIIALDLEPSARVLWISHFIRGVPGRWSVGRAACSLESEQSSLECPDLESVVLAGLRPRRSEDVDLVAALRAQAKGVESCIQKEDRVPIDERTFGRLELDLEVAPSGSARVVSIAPARVARIELGRCLSGAMEAINVGPFEGGVIRLKVPIDLD